MKRLRRLWCRVFHFRLWFAVSNISQVSGRFIWLRCPRDMQVYAFKIAITGKAPVGKTPIKLGD